MCFSFFWNHAGAKSHLSVAQKKINPENWWFCSIFTFVVPNNSNYGSLTHQYLSQKKRKTYLPMVVFNFRTFERCIRWIWKRLVRRCRCTGSCSCCCCRCWCCCWCCCCCCCVVGVVGVVLFVPWWIETPVKVEEQENWLYSGKFIALYDWNLACIKPIKDNYISTGRMFSIDRFCPWTCQTSKKILSFRRGSFTWLARFLFR